MIIHIKYQGSLHIVVQINANVKIVISWGRVFLITGQCHNLNKLGRGPLAGAIYQISK